MPSAIILLLADEYYNITIPCVHPPPRCRVPAGPLRPAQHLPLRTLRQLLLQADTCDCSPARVIARVTGVVPGLHGPVGRPEAATAPGGAGASAAAIAAAVVWPAANLKLQEEVAGPLDRGANGRTYVMGLQLQDATGACYGTCVGAAWVSGTGRERGECNGRAYGMGLQLQGATGEGSWPSPEARGMVCRVDVAKRGGEADGVQSHLRARTVAAMQMGGCALQCRTWHPVASG